jgi:hypothetical protein
MFEKKNKYNLKELMQENYTDMDIIRERPLVFKMGKVHIVIQPVKWLDHPYFLKTMAKMIMKYHTIFANLEFLSIYNYKENEAIKKLINEVTLFSNNKLYSKFIKDCVKFIKEWGFVAYGDEENESIEIQKIKSEKIFEDYRADEIIYMLFAIFVFNYDLVKKKTLEFLTMFKAEKKGKTKRGTFGSGLKSKVTKMPKYQDSPYNKRILQLFEQQSKMN